MNTQRKVKVLMGRNKGQVGTVTQVNASAVYVDFGGTVWVNEGFGSVAEYPDGYWVPRDLVEEV
jgi:hypothetical protein